MGSSRLRRVAVLFGIVAGSQLGHALVYSIRYGSDAGRYQSAGVHAYLPTLAAGVSVVLGIGLTASLVLVAAARCLRPRPAGCRPRPTVRFLDVLPALFVAQMIVFAGQESIEALAAGHAVPSAVDQLLVGTLGQLPAAAIAAAVIVWLLARLEEAWTVVVEGVSLPGVRLPAVSAPCACRIDADTRLRLSAAFPSAFRRRGPPLAIQL